MYKEVISNLQRNHHLTKMSEVRFSYFNKQKFSKSSYGDGLDPVLEMEIENLVDKINRLTFKDVIDVTRVYRRSSKNLEIYCCGESKLSKKIVSSDSPRFEMEDKVYGARHVTQTDYSPNLVLMMCKKCDSYCSYMTWFSGDENAILYWKECKEEEYKAQDVAMNSDIFLTVLGLAHGMLVCK